MLIYIFSLIFLYLFIGLVLFFLQRSMIFNKSIKPKRPIEYGLFDVREVFISTPDNLSLLAWFQIQKKNNSQWFCGFSALKDLYIKYKNELIV